MLKGLDGITTHEHREWIPILDNDQDMTRLCRSTSAPRCRPSRPVTRSCCGGTGCTRGARRWDAVRHVEILEFLLEAIGRGGLPRLMRRRSAAPEMMEIR